MYFQRASRTSLISRPWQPWTPLTIGIGSRILKTELILQICLSHHMFVSFHLHAASLKPLAISGDTPDRELVQMHGYDTRLKAANPTP